MKKRIPWKIIFVLVFGTTGWYLFDIMKQVESANPEYRKIRNYNNLIFSGGAGIDVTGKIINSFNINKFDEYERELQFVPDDLTIQRFKKTDSSSLQNNRSEKTVGVAAFLLRNSTLDADLKFWNEVNMHLFELDSLIVRLTGYCENYQCIDAIKANPDVAHFTVLEYGGIVDMQAVVSADTSGEFWLRGTSFKKYKWRSGTQTPFSVAMEIGMGL